MTFELRWATSAERDYRNVPPHERGRVDQALDDLKKLGNEASNVTPLVGLGGFRKRAGRWRIIFDRDSAQIHVLAIKARNEKTY